MNIIQLGAHANAIIFISLQSVETTSQLENEALSSIPGDTQTTAFARLVDNK